MERSQPNIADLLKKKDKGAISHLYDQYAPTLFGIVKRIVRSDEIAQDVLQEAFIKAWQNGPAFDEKKGTLFTWLLNIARNKAIDKTRSVHYRNDGKIQALDQNVYNRADLSTRNNPDHIDVKDAVDGLDEKYRIIIDLVYFQGFTQAEVQSILEIPLGTVKSRARIAMRELRKIFLEHKITILIYSLLAFGF